MEIPHTIAEIKFTITCLYKLPLRDPAPLDRYVAKSSGDMSIYQHFDILYVKDKFPTAEQNLVIRLGKLITRRRQLLASRSAHDQRLMPEDFRSDRLYPVKNTNSVPSNVLPTTDAQKPVAIAITRKSQSLASGTRETDITKASILRKETERDVKCREDLLERVSEYAPSMASSYAAKMPVEIPKRPRDEHGEELQDFKCPYCFIACHVETRVLWK